jgi:hypothetical protein
LIARMQRLGISRGSGPRRGAIAAARRNLGDPRWKFGRDARSTPEPAVADAIAN